MWDWFWSDFFYLSIVFHVQLAAYDFRHQATVNYDSIAANQTNEYKHLDVDTYIWC